MNNTLAFADVSNKIKSIAPHAIVFYKGGYVGVHLMDLTYPDSNIMDRHIDAICDYLKIGSRYSVEKHDKHRTIRSSLFVKNDLSIIVT